MKIRSCVTPQQQFMYGIHKPDYITANLRINTKISPLGTLDASQTYSNKVNFPDSDVRVKDADWIFEIPNPFSFRGSTFIDKEWADNSASNPHKTNLPPKEELSLNELFRKEDIPPSLFNKLPTALHLTLATSSTDPKDLVQLAEICCSFEKNKEAVPIGLRYTKDSQGRPRAVINNHDLFEAVANNPALPDCYKIVMVLRPGTQGDSEIVGDFRDHDGNHVFEYLRRNSYIAGGHYAANMADDAIRYSINDLSESDINGLRHLYYQRSFVRLATHLEIKISNKQKLYSSEALEQLRIDIKKSIKKGTSPEITSTLWGWNFGFDYAPTGYRLHASHQQIHQQYAMLPHTVALHNGSLHTSTETMPSFGCGDMIAEVIQSYHNDNKSDFFTDYLACIRKNVRMDDRDDLESSLIVWEDEHTILFVPKAQTSQWELQLMAKENENGEIIGNILEADTASRTSLNRGIFMAQKALAGLGARMVTSIEYPKRIGKTGETGQHLLYSLLPKLPQSPGAFSEAQLRYINGHYPEDFAAVCRQQLQNIR